MGILGKIFTWWDGGTIGTSLFTWRKGVKVGEDEQGNTYYRERNGKKRWVIYNGAAEASRVPPEWHRWLHHTTDKTPLEEPPVVRSWEKPHVPNLTGTDGAYHPPGSLKEGGERSRASSDYEAWTP